MGRWKRHRSDETLYYKRNSFPIKSPTSEFGLSVARYLQIQRIIGQLAEGPSPLNSAELLEMMAAVAPQVEQANWLIKTEGRFTVDTEDIVYSRLYHCCKD